MDFAITEEDEMLNEENAMILMQLCNDDALGCMLLLKRYIFYSR